jgi:VWFA-related protein
MVSLACVGAGTTVDVGGQAPTLRARVDVVTIDAYVHHDGRPVEGLTAADFLVRDEGVEQELRALGTTESAHVIVALDVSGSVTGDVRRRLDDALRRLLTHLTPVDRLSLITFADQVRIHHVAVAPDAVRAEDLGRARPVGATTLHDAVLVGSQLARADARPALLLVFTDGADTASWTTAGRVIDALRRTPVVVVTVGAGLPAAAASPRDATYFRAPSWLAAAPGDTVRLMDLLAESTGGEFVRVDGVTPLADVFASILDRYRQRYLLSFTPPADNPRGWHRLEVRLRKRQGTVIARPGYVVP